jgi:hypothetical protein
MGERGAEDKPKRGRWEKRNLLWEGEFKYFDHTRFLEAFYRFGALKGGVNLSDRCKSRVTIARFRDVGVLDV